MSKKNDFIRWKNDVLLKACELKYLWGLEIVVFSESIES